MPFHVYQNATLRELVEKKPTTDEQLLNITGIGRIKLKKYGKLILEEIRGFLQKYGTTTTTTTSDVSEFFQGTNAAPKRKPPPVTTVDEDFVGEDIESDDGSPSVSSPYFAATTSSKIPFKKKAKQEYQ